MILAAHVLLVLLTSCERLQSGIFCTASFKYLEEKISASSITFSPGKAMREARYKLRALLISPSVLLGEHANCPFWSSKTFKTSEINGMF